MVKNDFQTHFLQELQEFLCCTESTIEVKRIKPIKENQLQLLSVKPLTARLFTLTESISVYSASHSLQSFTSVHF